MTPMRFVYDDGGRSASGYRGEAGDCVVRAASIVTRLPYLEVYSLARNLARQERRTVQGRSSPRNGIHKSTVHRLMTELGLTWTPTMFIGSGCTMHLRSSEIPKGRLIVSLSRHTSAVIDRVIHDTFDPSREGMRCVYGYWR